MICLAKEVEELDNAVENHIEIFNFYTPRLDDLKELKQIEEDLVKKGIITIGSEDEKFVEVEFEEINEWDPEFCKGKTHTDEYGYLRWNHNKKLVHRDVAYKYVYLENMEEYPMPMGKYQVHHKDGNKKNNAPENLALFTGEEHMTEHRVRKK